ncbi:hypothetical protein FAES_4449 [Fibrella aestuarina BUZ 2]|uniref:Uncharacterized protein n=1 Tax=Fibrella aestuarina BUZ 2 TaxID=1166018 RepID=I0KE95_9BACT|nr:hypothetical protein FAES_4449 [Fibrella aestuarina BUZ 2]
MPPEGDLRCLTTYPPERTQATQFGQRSTGSAQATR